MPTSVWWCERERFLYWRKPEKEPHPGQGCCREVDLVEREEDLGTCEYFRRYHKLEPYDPEAICSFGCVEEPACITCMPGEGWPSIVGKGT